jgi:hypothetical protein
MTSFARMSPVVVAALCAATVHAQPVLISTGAPDGRLGMATLPAGNGLVEHETGDDFLLTHASRLTSASFFGLLPSGLGTAGINRVAVEIYRVFPFDSDVGRTSGPPTFSTSQVPTRVNSPGDVELVDRSLGSGLSFTATLLGSFSVDNSVVNGIHPTPGNLTGGEGSVIGDEVRIDATFTTPFDLAAGHYFLVPQVGLTSGSFLWLSAARPITGPGTTPFTPDLQTWIRDANLDPDWLRVGTDIVGGGQTFDAAFSLSGSEIPEPSSILLVASGLTALVLTVRRQRRFAGASASWSVHLPRTRLARRPSSPCA